jgi:hypothetical protein
MRTTAHSFRAGGCRSTTRNREAAEVAYRAIPRNAGGLARMSSPDVTVVGVLRCRDLLATRIVQPA